MSSEHWLQSATAIACSTACGTREVNVNVLEIARDNSAGSISSGLIKTIAICETQPVTAEGLRTLLQGSADLRFAQAIDSLGQASMLLRQSPPDVLLLDKSFGIPGDS